jgi:ferredoxin
MTSAFFNGKVCTSADASVPFEAFDAWPDQPLLLSIEQGQLAWPSSCRNGTCRTCIGQLQQGQVRYDMDWPGLTAEEKAQGCVLPCVAYPVSDVLLAPCSDSTG